MLINILIIFGSLAVMTLDVLLGIYASSKAGRLAARLEKNPRKGLRGFIDRLDILQEVIFACLIFMGPSMVLTFLSLSIFSKKVEQIAKATNLSINIFLTIPLAIMIILPLVVSFRISQTAFRKELKLLESENASS